MFRAFELTIDDAKLTMDWFRKCAIYGKNKISAENSMLKEWLREFISHETIDGTALTERFFPTLHSDVFLSYSHNDSDLAYMVAGMLSSCLKLSVFIDSQFWGGADELLKEIDNKYCHQGDSKTYSYEKRNYSTSHVHAMLSSAIIKAMDQAEIIIFLNTPNSVPNIARTIDDGGYDYTLSPWIYEEMLFASLLRERDWQTYRRRLRILDSADIFERNLNIAYKLPKDRLVSLSISDIEDWISEYTKRKENGIIDYDILDDHYDRHPLNVLYELKFGLK